MHGGGERPRVNRLRDESIATGASSPLFVGSHGVGRYRHYDDGIGSGIRFQAFDQLQAIHSGELQVQKNQRRLQRAKQLEGVLRVPDDDEFAEALRHKGIPAQLQLQTFTRVGPSPSAFVRATQGARNVVGRSIERVFPAKEAGLLLGLLLGDDSQLDPDPEPEPQPDPEPSPDETQGNRRR